MRGEFDIRMHKLLVEDAVRAVLKEKHSTLFGKSYDIVDEKGLERAVKELTSSLVFPVLVELDIVKGTNQNEQQGTLALE